MLAGAWRDCLSVACPLLLSDASSLTGLRRRRDDRHYDDDHIFVARFDHQPPLLLLSVD